MQRTLVRMTLALCCAAALAFLAGCGGDDGGLSAEDMARLDAAEAAAAANAAAAAAAEAAAEAAAAEAETAHEEAEAAKAEAAAAHEEAEAAEAAAEAAQAEAEAAKADAAAATEAAAEAADVEVPEVDTSALDDAIEALATQVEALVSDTEALQEATADPATPLAILGGTKSAMSANDREALAKKIIGQLNGTYDHDGDMSLISLADIDGVAATSNAVTANRVHATGGRIVSGDGTATDSGFLRHSFTGGPSVDLTSPGDIATLRVGNLLKVNGVDLKSFSIKETDKVGTATGDAFTLQDAVLGDTFATADTFTVTTTLGADGSSSVVVTSDAVGNTTYSETITYEGGHQIVRYFDAAGAAPNNPLTATLAARGARGAGSIARGPAAAIGNIAVVTRADGDTYAVSENNQNTGYVVAGPVPFNPANLSWTNGTILPASSQAIAKAAYANAAFTIAQHNAVGYGAWLADSFFAAYVINAEDDAILNDPDATAMKIAWGHRAYDSTPASNLSGRGETAMWKGLMVGHDMDADAATAGEMLKGNASITARVGEATLADASAARVPDIVDLSLTNIITADGTAVSRVADGIHWTNLDLTGGSFAKGSEVMGTFYDNGNEVVGEFDKEDILGVFGALEYEAMDDMMAEN